MKSSRTRFLLLSAVVLGLVMLESPIILLANRIEPTVMGMPFLLAWVLFWWAFCTAVFLVAYLLNWGRPRTAGTTADNRPGAGTGDDDLQGGIPA